jgi:hypothetical protein
MYKELLENLEVLAAQLPSDQLEKIAAETLEELNAALTGNKLDIDTLSKEIAFLDLANDVAVDAADVGRTQGLVAGAAGTVGALALGDHILKNHRKGMKKKAHTYRDLLEKLANAENVTSMLDTFSKLAETMPAEDLEVIASEVLEKEAFMQPVFRAFTGLGGAVQGASAGRRAFKGAKQGLKDYNAGYGTLPRSQRGGIPRTVQDQYTRDQAIVNQGYWGSVRGGAQVGRENSLDRFDAAKQQAAVDTYNYRAGYDPPQGNPGQGNPGQGNPGQGSPPQGNPRQGNPRQGNPGQGSPGQGSPGQGSPGQGSPGQGSPGQGSPPPTPPQGTPLIQQAGQWVQQNPYLAAAAGVGAGMMIPRAMAGANAAANAQMMVPAAPYAPYPYYR